MIILNKIVRGSKRNRTLNWDWLINTTDTKITSNYPNDIRRGVSRNDPLGM